MKILITGGAGFIGSNVADKLVELGHKVVIVDNLSTGKNEYVNPKAVFYKMDIRDKKLESIFKKEKPDIVNHHAAQMDVRVSVEKPDYDADINLMGLLNILQNCVKYKVKKVIYISSGGVVYGETDKACKETDKKDPQSPYGITKLTGETYLYFYSKVYGLKFTSLRYSNVYGPRQDPHGEAGVVAIFSRLMIANKEATIFGDGKQSRDFVFVKDVVDANIKSLKKGDGEAYNIGTGNPTSVNELFDRLSKIAGYNQKPKHVAARPGELLINYLDVKKAKKELNWSPKHSSEQGLKETFNWIKEN